MRRKTLPLLLLCGALPSCAPRGLAPVCPPGQGQPSVQYELFFGRSVSGRGEVTGREWDAFIDQAVVPNLPHGFTVLDADGAWMAPSGRATERERSKLLIAVVPDDAGSLAAIGRIRRAYQERFHQQLVGQAVLPVCAEF